MGMGNKQREGKLVSEPADTSEKAPANSSLKSSLTSNLVSLLLVTTPRFRPLRERECDHALVSICPKRERERGFIVSQGVREREQKFAASLSPLVGGNRHPFSSYSNSGSHSPALMLCLSLVTTTKFAERLTK